MGQRGGMRRSAVIAICVGAMVQGRGSLGSSVKCRELTSEGFWLVLFPSVMRILPRLGQHSE